MVKTGAKFLLEEGMLQSMNIVFCKPSTKVVEYDKVCIYIYPIQMKEKIQNSAWKEREKWYGKVRGKIAEYICDDSFSFKSA